MKQDRKLRVALVGTGGFGTDLAQYINEVAELVAICDSSAPARRRFAETTGLRLAEFQELAPLLAEIDIDALAITTPHHTHRQITVEAARAGKHVYCEKAMANTVPECWEMVRTCAGAGSLKPLIARPNKEESLSACLYTPNWSAIANFAPDKTSMNGPYKI